MKDTFDAINSDQDGQKDKKIIDLAKKNRGLQLQVESLKTKAAKAAEVAIKLKKDNDKLEKAADKLPLEETTMTNKDLAGMDDSKKVKELEKRVTKLRNENQTLSTQMDKATRLLEREIGEVIDIDSLYKEESQWKGRA